MYIRVKVTPDSKGDSVTKITDDTFSVLVRPKAEHGQANRRIVFVMSKYFGVSAEDVRIVTGHRSKNKILDISVE